MYCRRFSECGARCGRRVGLRLDLCAAKCQPKSHQKLGEKVRHDERRPSECHGLRNENGSKATEEEPHDREIGKLVGRARSSFSSRCSEWKKEKQRTCSESPGDPGLGRVADVSRVCDVPAPVESTRVSKDNECPADFSGSAAWRELDSADPRTECGSAGFLCGDGRQGTNPRLA